jgi:excisionase family DNA binding protein
MTTPRQMLTIKQVTEILQVGQTTVFGLLKTGELPSVKIGSARRIPSDALDQFIAERMDVPVTSGDLRH